MDLIYTVPVTLGGTRFTALRIVQRLIASAPAEGDIAQAHQPDEYLEVSEFEAGQRFMRDLVAELAV